MWFLTIHIDWFSKIIGDHTLCLDTTEADPLYTLEEAESIVETTVKMIRNAVVDNGGGASMVANVFLLFCPGWKLTAPFQDTSFKKYLVI